MRAHARRSKILRARFMQYSSNAKYPGYISQYILVRVQSLAYVGEGERGRFAAPEFRWSRARLLSSSIDPRVDDEPRDAMSPRCRLQHGHGGRRHHPGALRRAWRGGSCGPPGCHSLRGARALAEPEFQSEFQPEFHPGQHRRRTGGRHGRYVAAHALAVSGCSGRRWVVRISLSGIMRYTEAFPHVRAFKWMIHLEVEGVYC